MRPTPSGLDISMALYLHATSIVIAIPTAPEDAIKMLHAPSMAIVIPTANLGICGTRWATRIRSEKRVKV